MTQAHQRLDESGIARHLEALGGTWAREGDALARSFKFVDFRQAFAFLTHVALLAEKAEHHPEIHNIYNHVRLRLTTHDAGGLTRLDFELAAAIDAAASER